MSSAERAVQDVAANLYRNPEPGKKIRIPSPAGSVAAYLG
jgi:hypothetical protein